MNELQLMVDLKAGSIVMNTDEIKMKLSKKMSEYKNLVFTEESKQIAKSELASLRKLKKEVDDRRKSVKAKWLEPYEAFEKEAKELINIIDEPIVEINAQLSEMEAERIRKKRADIQVLYEEVVGEASEYLPFDEIYDSKWDNAGTSMKKIREALEELVKKTALDISVIQNSLSDVKEDALCMYKKDRDLSKALNYMNTYEINKQKALEIERERLERAETRRKEEEIARVRADERRHLEEMQKLQKQVEDIPGISFEQEEDDELPFVQPSTITAFYKIVATAEELEQVETIFNSIGIFFERRDG